MAAPIDPYVARFRRKYTGDEELRRHVAALFEIVQGVLGADKLVLRAGKLGALKLMRSRARSANGSCALRRLVFEDPTIERVPARTQFRADDRGDRRRRWPT